MNILRRHSTAPEQFEFAFCSIFPTHGIIAELPAPPKAKHRPRAKHHVETHMTPEEIFAKWEPLAYTCVDNWNIPGYDRDDLLQEARMAIHKMSSRFDANRGCFFTAAKRAIMNRLATLSKHSKRQKRTAIVNSLDEPLVAGDESSTSTLYDAIEAAGDLPSGVNLEEVLRGYLQRIRNRKYKDPGTKHAEIDAALAKIRETFGIQLERLAPEPVSRKQKKRPSAASLA